MELVPLLVKIGLQGKHHKYPAFNRISSDIRNGLDWSEYIDTIPGGGWKYDKVAGHFEIDGISTESGTWLGVMLVPEAFADAAESLFPDDVEPLTEAEYQDFIETRCTVNQDDDEVNEKVLSAIAAKKSAGIELSVNDAKALDPDDDRPGITRNKNKYWKDIKSRFGLTIKSDKCRSGRCERKWHGFKDGE